MELANGYRYSTLTTIIKKMCLQENFANI